MLGKLSKCIPMQLSCEEGWKMDTVDLAHWLQELAQHVEALEPEGTDVRDATIRKLRVERLDLRVERDDIDQKCSEVEHELAEAKAEIADLRKERDDADACNAFADKTAERLRSELAEALRAIQEVGDAEG